MYLEWYQCAAGVRPPGSGMGGPQGGPPGQQQQHQGGVPPAGAPPGMRPVAAPRPSFGPGSPGVMTNDCTSSMLLVYRITVLGTASINSQVVRR